MPMEVSVSFQNDASGIEPITRTMTLGDDMQWHYEGPELALAGTWTLQVDALIDDFDKAMFDVQLPLR
jgi:copper transport protein